jgi:hypothetical protein
MPRKQSNDSFSEQEAIARREAALKRMLTTPHKPHGPVGKKPKADAKDASAKPKNA